MPCFDVSCAQGSTYVPRMLAVDTTGALGSLPGVVRSYALHAASYVDAQLHVRAAMQGMLCVKHTMYVLSVRVHSNQQTSPTPTSVPQPVDVNTTMMMMMTHMVSRHGVVMYMLRSVIVCRRMRISRRWMMKRYASRPEHVRRSMGCTDMWMHDGRSCAACSCHVCSVRHSWCVPILRSSATHARCAAFCVMCMM